MILDDLPPNIDEKEMERIVIQRFRKLRSLIFGILPEKCFLKPKAILTGKMVKHLDVAMIEKGLIETEDICSLCDQTACPYNDVKNKKDRLNKILLIGLPVKSTPN